MKQWQPVKRFDDDAKYFVFEKPGDALEGKLLRIAEAKTKHGKATLATVEREDGEKYFFAVTAGMYLPKELTGKYVKVEYVENAINPKTKRRFKRFETYVAEDELYGIPF